MDILYLLVPLSVVLVFVIGMLFWWSVKSGQFEDLEGPAYRILMDDDTPGPGGAHQVPERKDDQPSGATKPGLDPDQ